MQSWYWSSKEYKENVLPRFLAEHEDLAELLDYSGHGGIDKESDDSRYVLECNTVNARLCFGGAVMRQSGVSRPIMFVPVYPKPGFTVPC